jgi:hypothetical protein
VSRFSGVLLVMTYKSSLQSLERLCRAQATLTSDPRTSQVLEEMASEYRLQAGREEQDGEQEQSQKE